MKEKTITIRISAAEFKALQIYCKDKDIGISQAVRILMAEKLAYYLIDKA